MKTRTNVKAGQGAKADGMAFVVNPFDENAVE